MLFAAREERMGPSVPVGGVRVVALPDEPQYPRPLPGSRLVAATPFAEARPADPAQPAELLHGELLGKGFDYRVFFSDKGTN